MLFWQQKQEQQSTVKSDGTIQYFLFAIVEQIKITFVNLVTQIVKYNFRIY